MNDTFVSSHSQRLIWEWNLGSVVLGGGDEHGEIHRRLDVVDLPAVLLHLLQNISRLSPRKRHDKLTQTKCAERATGGQRSHLFPPWRWTGWSLHFHGQQWQNLPEVPTQHWWSCAHCRAKTGTAGCPLQEEKQHDLLQSNIRLRK